MKKYFLLFLVFILVNKLFCQENFLPGYIISLKGDTIFGEIDYRNWEKNPSKISFREYNEGKTILSPINIIGFKVSDEIYKSAIVKTEISPEQTNELKFGAELNFEIDTVFLQTMIQGEKSLYFYLNTYLKQQFYILSDSVYEFLVYKRYFKKVDDNKVIAENKKYIGQLSLYLQDCKSINTKLINTSYNKKSLEKLFSSYYNCVGSGIGFEKKTENLKAEFGILAGLSFTSLKFKSESIGFLSNSNYSVSKNFSGGFFCDILIPRNFQRWSLNNQFLYNSYKVTANYIDIKSVNEQSKYFSTFSFSYLKMVNVLKYKYPVKNFHVFVDVGITNGLAIDESNYMRKEYNYYSVIHVTEEKALEDVRKYEQGFIAGLGTEINNISLNINFEKSNGMSEYRNLGSSALRFYVLMGYKF